MASFLWCVARTVAFQGKNIHDVTYPELAQSILDVDTAGWQNLGKFSENVL